MKVFEVMTMTPDQLKYQQVPMPARKKWTELGGRSTPARKKVGSGVYAKVYAPEDQPGDVEKVTNPKYISSLAKDGYYQYLDMLAHDQHMSNNIYFPKVYSLKTFRGSDGKYTYKVNMEKLHKLNSLSNEEAEMIGNRLFEGFDKKIKTAKTFSTGAKRFTTQRRQAYLHQLIIEGLAYEINEGLYGKIAHIKDPKLISALKLIGQIIKSDEEAFSADIHSHNIMVRRGPFIPQLVITDPISHATTGDV